MGVCLFRMWKTETTASGVDMQLWYSKHRKVLFRVWKPKTSWQMDLQLRHRKYRKVLRRMWKTKTVREYSTRGRTYV